MCVRKKERWRRRDWRAVLAAFPTFWFSEAAGGVRRWRKYWGSKTEEKVPRSVAEALDVSLGTVRTAKKDGTGRGEIGRGGRGMAEEGFSRFRHRVFAELTGALGGTDTTRTHRGRVPMWPCRSVRHLAGHCTDTERALRSVLYCTGLYSYRPHL
ncbi:hypothetical protein B0T11DRAFT_98607 [Plectosphaerella cucumerina]|uniref:Uncharacterized protein n=1 Tax=Plectosphaerella cucumerina TaxID=40658 RepID=A0A8K0T9Z5_9PEZI|nr:hypothetical protein B0T11DRAFT_98607 [Plectosphaerella cucumerina]